MAPIIRNVSGNRQMYKTHISNGVHHHRLTYIYMIYIWFCPISIIAMRAHLFRFDGIRRRVSRKRLCRLHILLVSSNGAQTELAVFDSPPANSQVNLQATTTTTTTRREIIHLNIDVVWWKGSSGRNQDSSFCISQKLVLILTKESLSWKKLSTRLGVGRNWRTCFEWWRKTKTNTISGNTFLGRGRR